MKTKSFYALALAAALPFAMLGACTSDDSSTQDSGPQNKPDTGAGDANTQQDTAAQDVSTNDAGIDAPNPCSTGITFDNTVVPGWPNNVPTP